LALGGALTAYANGEFDLMVSIILAYIGIEGLGDAIQRFANTKYVAPAQKQAEIADQFFKSDDDDDVDKNAIIAGQ